MLMDDTHQRKYHRPEESATQVAAHGLTTFFSQTWTYTPHPDTLRIRRRQTLENLYRISVRILDENVAPDSPFAWLGDFLDGLLFNRSQGRVELLRIDDKAEMHRISA